MYKHTLTIGLNDKDTLKQEIPTSKFMSIISNAVGDCTIKEGATGYYTMRNGVKVVEKSLTVEKFGGSKKAIIEVAKYLKQVLNQEAIILTTERSNSSFI